MREVEQVTAEYLPIAQACSSVYFTLEQLNLINHFYQFSLSFFMDIFDYVLHHNPNLQGVSDYASRRQILYDDLFLVVFKRTSRALLHQDHVTLAMLLAQVKLRNVEDLTDEYEFLLEGGETVAMSSAQGVEATGSGLLTPEQEQRLLSHSRHIIFKPVQLQLRDRGDEWASFLE